MIQFGISNLIGAALLSAHLSLLQRGIIGAKGTRYACQEFGIAYPHQQKEEENVNHVWFKIFHMWFINLKFSMKSLLLLFDFFLQILNTSFEFVALHCYLSQFIALYAVVIKDEAHLIPRNRWWCLLFKRMRLCRLYEIKKV